MISRRLFLVVVAVTLLALSVRAAEERPFFAIDGMPARFALPIYERLSGKRVAMTDEVKALSNPIFASYGGDDRKAALERLQRALLDQGKVEIVVQKDGSLLARIKKD